MDACEATRKTQVPLPPTLTQSLLLLLHSFSLQPLWLLLLLLLLDALPELPLEVLALLLLAA